MPEPVLLFWGIFFSAIGLGFFIYGRKQHKVIPLLTGVTLFIFPYFVTDLLNLVLIGIILIGIPYFVRQ